MEIIKVVAFAFTALFIVLIFKGRRDDLAIQVSIAAGVLIFLFMINTVFKILAIAYLASFCSEICKDAGENSIAAKVEFSGKILILVLAIPILMAVMQSILKIM
jgi:stage III sporulation protein AD